MTFKMAATAGLILTLDHMGKCFKTLLLWNHLDNWNKTAHEWSLEGPLQCFCFFYADRKSKMATTAGHRLTLDPMWKCSNAFFSETTNQTESKLDRNVHLMVLYKDKFFWSDIKWKMAATAGLSLTLDLPRMIIGRSSTKVRLFMSIVNSRWPPLQDID